jgi:hypothetical protein
MEKYMNGRWKSYKKNGKEAKKETAKNLFEVDDVKKKYKKTMRR